MGLCKCPKRKVTNQFCFEHRVNVCEHCMVQKHPKCVVQSYLLWLQDSDYNPQCEYCNRDLAEEVCVRLVCYHVYHWVCLDKHARGLPPDTAPAGYVCKLCSAGLFPPDNMVGPVADTLRGKLKEVNWARAGLGLPLLEARSERRPEFSREDLGATAASSSSSSSFPAGPRLPPEGENSSGEMAGAHSHHTIEVHGGGASSSEGDHHLHHLGRGSKDSSSSAQVSEATTLLATDHDIDENKYKRKSAIEMLFRWIKNFASGSRRRHSRVQRYLMVVLLLLFAFLTFLMLMSYIAGSRNYEDPMLEPLNNPNIHVGVNR